MPLYIDPEWEYYVANPDIEEILTFKLRTRKALFDVFGISLEKDDRSTGFQHVPTDNPNYARTRLAPVKFKDRYAAEPARRMPEREECPTCGWVFRPYRKGQIYCGNSCRPNYGVLPRERSCVVCSRPFRPRYSTHHICSKTCLGVEKTRRARQARGNPRCQECNKEITSRASRFCGMACYNLHRLVLPPEKSNRDGGYGGDGGSGGSGEHEEGGDI